VHALLRHLVVEAMAIEPEVPNPDGLARCERSDGVGTESGLRVGVESIDKAAVDFVMLTGTVWAKPFVAKRNV